MADAQHADQQLGTVEAVDDADGAESQASEAFPLTAQGCSLEGVLAQGLDGPEDLGLKVSR